MGSVHSVIIRYAVFSDLLFIYSKINRLLFGLFIYLYLTWVYRYFFLNKVHMLSIILTYF